MEQYRVQKQIANRRSTPINTTFLGVQIGYKSQQKTGKRRKLYENTHILQNP